jgi:hypothetical protein
MFVHMAAEIKAGFHEELPAVARAGVSRVRWRRRNVETVQRVYDELNTRQFASA